ncbi:MAG: hypothetical protein R3C04_11830 [Hyphomonas sp.]
MSAQPEARPSGRDLLARQQASENFELARHGGSWMVVTGFLAAFLWIGGIVVVALGYFGVPALQAMSPWLLAGAGMVSLIPAFLIVMAGYMGRTNRRASASNALVMEAAVRLMAPAREAGTEGITFAEQMKQAAAEVDKAMSHALTAMKAMSGEIGDERHRLEQVAYASADNARDLTQRLAAERQALEGLARELRTQLQQMNEAIPRQAQMMVELARQAGDEVSRADEALEGRLMSMQSASHALADRLVDLDALASDAAARTEALTFAISRVEEKLDQSRRTVDAAVRAGEIAAAAAMTTGDALKEAVATAIDGARAASHEITEKLPGLPPKRLPGRWRVCVRLVKMQRPRCVVPVLRHGTKLPAWNVRRPMSRGRRHRLKQAGARPCGNAPGNAPACSDRGHANGNGGMHMVTAMANRTAGSRGRAAAASRAEAGTEAGSQA